MYSFIEQLFAPLIQVVNLTTLAIVSFIEAIFSPLPPDALIIPLVLERPDQALWIAFVTSFFSVAGAVVGFWIGLKGGRPLLLRYVQAERVQRVEDLYNRYDVSAVFITAFTPIPYKVFAVAAGVFRLSLWRFVVVSFAGRFARFALLTLLVRHYGQQTMEFVSRYFEPLTLGVGLIAVVFYIVWRARKKAT